MGKLVFQATLGGQVNLVGPNTASTYDINVPAVAGNMVTTGDTGTVTNTMLASSAYTAPGTIGSGTPNTGAFTTLTTTSTINGLTVGKGAGSVSTNTAVGASALAANTSGDRSTAVGNNAGAANTTGILDAFGSNALAANTTGNYNKAFGESALLSNTTGSSNAAFGGSALRSNTTGGSNIAIGDSALRSNTTASNNTAVGYQAGYTNTTGTGNVLVGMQAGYNSTGSYNTFVGTINSGSSACGGAMTTGSKNTILGGYTGNNGGLDIRTSNNYIVLSDGDGNPRGIFDGSGNFLVGTTSTYTNTAKFNVVQSTASNTAAAIATSYASDAGQAALYIGKYDNVSSTGQLFIRFQVNNTANGCGQINGNGAGAAAFGSYSDERLKENIVDLEPQLANITALRPVEFDYIESEGGGHQTGFIAQNMQQVYPDAVGERYDGMLTITGWSKTEARLVKAIQELNAKVDAQAAEIAALKGQA